MWKFIFITFFHHLYSAVVVETEPLMAYYFLITQKSKIISVESN